MKLKHIIYFFFLFITIRLYGVGVTEVDPNGDNLSLMFSLDVTGGGTKFMNYNSDADDRLYISMKANESLNFGFQFWWTPFGEFSDQTLETTNSFVRVRDNAGNIVFGPVAITPGSPGHIEDRASASAPTTLDPTGYDPLIFNSTTAGDYFIEVTHSTDGGITSNITPGTWFTARLYDFTVLDNNGIEQEGRLWSRSWHITAGDFETEMISTQYIYTDDGFVSSLDYNGVQPFRFVLVANETGVTNTGDVIKDRQSIESDGGGDLIPQHRLFFDLPDTTIFKTADIDEVFGELLAPITMSSCEDDYCIEVNVSKPIHAKVTIERNGIDGFQENSTDFILEHELVTGENCIPWNGRDGLGNSIAEVELEIELSFLAGITHLPLYDAENNLNGFNIDFLFPEELAGPAGVFWDDSQLDLYTGDIGDINLTTPCTSNCHSWGDDFDPFRFGYGDLRIINSYWFIERKPLIVKVKTITNYLEVSNDTLSCQGDSVTISANTNGLFRWMLNGEQFSTEDTLTFPLNGDSIFIAEANYIRDNQVINGSFEHFTTIRSDYIRQTSNTPLLPGSYTLTDLSTKVNPSYPSLQDHTSGNGQFMIINGNNISGSEINGTEVMVTNGVTYNFSAWFTNLEPNKGNLPNLEFYINGNSVGKISLSGHTDWERVDFFWESNITGNIDVAIINNSSSSQTNDFALDDIVFGSIEHCKDTKPVSVKTFKTLYPSVSLNLPNGICENNDFTVNIATSANLGTDPIYNWYVNDILQPETSTSLFLKKPSNKDLVKLIALSSNTVCVIEDRDSSSIEIQVFDLPVITLQPTTEICAGESTQLNSTSSKPIVNYLWDNVSLLNNASIANPIASPFETTNYQLIVTDTDACKDTAVIQVIVNPIPSVTVSGIEKICLGETTQLIASGANNYSWSPASSLNNPAIFNPIATPLLHTTYYVTGTTKGCPNIDSINVIVLDDPTPALNISYDNDICTGDIITVSLGDNIHLGDNPNYTWFQIRTEQNDTLSLGNELPLQLTNFGEGDRFYLDVVSNEICVEPEKLNAQSNIVDPKIYLYPDLKISGDPTVCFGENTMLTVVDANKVSSTYSWTDLVNETFETSDTFFIVNNVRSPRNITVSASNWLCKDSVSFSIIPIQAQLDIFSEDDIILLGSSSILEFKTNASEITLTNSVLNEERIITPSPLPVTPLESTLYSGVVVDNEGCIATDSLLITVIQTISAPYFFSPNNDGENDHWIVANLNYVPDTRVTIYNRWGGKVTQLDSQENIWDGTSNFSGEVLPDGVYFYVIEGSLTDLKKHKDIYFSGYVTLSK